MRLFIGIKVLASDINEWDQSLKRLRKSLDQMEVDYQLMQSQNYHVTLIFLGERKSEEIPKIISQMDMAALNSPPLELKINYTGAFPDERSARVLSLGVQRKRSLLELKDRLAEALAKEGIVDSGLDEFSPHITFARLRNPTGLRDTLSPFRRKSWGKIALKEIVLFKSEQRGHFVAYTPLHTSILTGTETKDHS